MSRTADTIQSHLYQAFLHAHATDVSLRVRASWQATYRLHRVILIQAGFFNALFTAGWGESRKSDEIDIIFDDANITRGAFELCISRLYGGGPPLHIFPSLIPSTAKPLTSNFPFTSESVDLHPSTPPGHHPGTPRFLLSLLATSVYLSIPSLAAHALSSILSTIGPYTVLQYLKFALGKPIGPVDANWDEPEAAIGLENIAELLTDEGGSLHSIDTEDSPPEKEFHYGAMSDKIGEAAACWLVRWAPDMLAFEEAKAGIGIAEPALSRRRLKPEATAPDYSAVPTIWDRGGLSVKWVCALLSADTLFVHGERARYDLVRSVVELRRRHGILQDEEDAWKVLFDERIYYCHMSMEDVIVLSKDSSPTTKQPFVSIAVLQAAHWQNSLMRQHITARPASSSFETRPAPAPSPGSPVQREKELGITQTTAEIRARLAAADPSLDQTGPYYLVAADSSVRIGDNGTSVHPPSVDGVPLSMDELFTTTFTPSTSPTTPKPAALNTLTRPSTGEANFFGIQTRRYTARECIAADPAGTARWTLHPPFRFAAEFWDAEALPEKARLYSHTVWCGGSLFNAYVQVVRKKGAVQLGIYLHRQSTLDIPGASGPRGETPTLQQVAPVQRPRMGSLVGGQEQTRTHTRGPSLPAIVSPPASPAHYSPSIHPPTRSTTPLSAVSSSLPSSTSFTSSLTHHPSGYSLQPPAAPTAPYRDPRPSVSAYFTISCASATGASQTRFASAPDVFSVSQSWGWKSSALRTEEYIEVGEGAEASVGTRGREVSLRACVVLGLV
ncbi:hypothetical protein B0H16DRAFT_1487742 [Mycena metata]|uniref:BTB domain-containing protein n=1 Tax=Mycena metata TaxID=1033252 RepID=A0AAD7KHF1_9AGAR|nr:hypothetical protein B0H16DRAFT_1487742 [Mycena metata]